MSGEPTGEFIPPVVEAEVPQTPTVAAKGYLDTSLRDVRDSIANSRIARRLTDKKGVLSDAMIMAGGINVGYGVAEGNVLGQLMGFGMAMAGVTANIYKNSK